MSGNWRVDPAGVLEPRPCSKGQTCVWQCLITTLKASPKMPERDSEKPQLHPGSRSGFGSPSTRTCFPPPPPHPETRQPREEQRPEQSDLIKGAQLSVRHQLVLAAHDPTCFLSQQTPWMSSAEIWCLYH